MKDNRVIHVEEMDRFPGSVYIGRQMKIRYPSLLGKYGVKRYERSLFANPYRIGERMTREHVLEVYHQLFYSKIETQPGFVDALIGLRGKTLACWCRHFDEEMTPETACHGDIILATLDLFDDEQIRTLQDLVTVSAR